MKPVATQLLLRLSKSFDNRREFEKALAYDREKAGGIMTMIQKLDALERDAHILLDKLQVDSN